MAFHFATLANEEQLYNVVIPSETADEARAKIGTLAAPHGDAVILCVHKVRDSLHRFLSTLRDHPEESMLLDLHRLGTLRDSWLSQGREMMDANAATLAPFQTSRIFVGQEPSGDQPSFDFLGKADQARFSSEAMIDIAMKTIACGMEKRIAETEDYSLYLASGIAKNKKREDYIVRAESEPDLREGVNAFAGKTVNVDVIHRLSPRLQSLVSLAMRMEKTADYEGDDPCDISFSSGTFRELSRSVLKEGGEVYLRHAKVYDAHDSGFSLDTGDRKDIDHCLTVDHAVTLPANEVHGLIYRLLCMGIRETAKGM